VTRSGGSEAVDLSADAGGDDDDVKVAYDDDAKVAYSNESENQIGGDDNDHFDVETLSEHLLVNPPIHVESLSQHRRQVRSVKSLGSNADDSHPFRFPAAVILVVVVLYVSLRGRRKDSAKMNWKNSDIVTIPETEIRV
jgi:hypothetical protein